MFSIYFTLQLILNHIAFHIILYPFFLKSLPHDPFWPSGLPSPSFYSSSVRAMGSPETAGETQPSSCRRGSSQGCRGRREWSVPHSPSGGQGGSGVSQVTWCECIFLLAEQQHKYKSRCILLPPGLTSLPFFVHQLISNHSLCRFILSLWNWNFHLLCCAPVRKFPGPYTSHSPK